MQFGRQIHFFMWVAYEDEGIRKEESIHNLGRRESD